MTHARKLLIGTLVTAALLAPAHVVRAEGEFTFGSQWWSQTHPEALYQQFRVIPQGAFLESFLVRDRFGPYGWQLTGTHAIRDDQAYQFQATRSKWRLDLDYTGIPHLFSQIAVSPYTTGGPGILLLPDSLQRINQEFPSGTSYAATMKDLLRNSPRVPLGIQSDVTVARLRGRPVSDWRFDLKARRIQRSGSKAIAGSFGFSSALELPGPVSETMTDVDATADWRRSKVKLQLTAGTSLYDDALNFLRWDNPQRLTNTTTAGAQGQEAAPPDNTVLRGNVALGVDLPKQSLLTVAFGAAQNQQDQDWQPLSANPAVVQRDSLPAKSPNAKAAVINSDVRLLTHMVPKLTATARFHYHDYDNQTPEWTFIGQSNLDQGFTRGAVTAEPFGNKQTTFGLDLDYQVLDWVTVGGVLEHRTRDRTHREVEKDDEDVFGGEFRAHPRGELEIGGRWKHAERKLDTFNEEDFQNAVGAFVEQPGLRRYDIANRSRDDAGATLWYSFGDRLDASADYGYLKDDYPDSELGLEDATQHLVASEGTFHLNGSWDLNGGYTYAQLLTNQKSRESVGSTLVISSDTTSWTAQLEDKSWYYFVTLDWEARKDKLTFTAGYEATRALENFILDNFKHTAQSIPSTYQLRQDLLFNAAWRANARTTVELRYAYEEFKIRDVVNTNIPYVFPLTGSVTAVYLGDSLQGYLAHKVALAARYTF